MKVLHIAMIRIKAQELVGTCTDYQIAFCAQKAGVLGRIYEDADGQYKIVLPNDLEDFADIHLRKISDWMNSQT